MPYAPLVALLALVGERLVGYPPALDRRIGHPVAWLGHLIGRLEAVLNRPSAAKINGRLRGRLGGVIALAAVVAVSVIVTVPLTLVLRALPYGFVLEAILAIPFLAQRDLARAVSAVADSLEHGVEQGRDAVRHIVGRDPELLNRPGIARAAIESVAENASDAVVAPALYLALFGLPGIVIYKAVNTADSMIGHRSKRYRHFGWAAARLDDVVNLPASRLTGLLIAAAAAIDGRGDAALRAMWRDAGKHVSPNAGWAEAAMAGALEIRLGGPRAYQGQSVDLAWLGTGRDELDEADIRRAVVVYRRMLTLLLMLVTVTVILMWLASSS